MNDFGPVPAGYEVVAVVRSSRFERLLRAKYEGRDVALRIVTFPEGQAPLIDPTFVWSRVNSIVGELGVRTFAMQIATGQADSGHYVAEEWIGRGDLAKQGPLPWNDLAQRILPLARDLATVHAARKWHGGIRPRRLRLVDQTIGLAAYGWAAWMSAQTGETAARIEPADRPSSAYVAPELSASRVAGTALDCYGLCKSLLDCASDIPQDALTVLQRGLVPDLEARTTMAELVDLLA